MEKFPIYIKNMVCNRCIKVVKAEFDKLNLPILHIELGKVIVAKLLTDNELNNLKKNLESEGFELLDDKKTQIIEQVKTLIINIIHHNQESPKFNYSVYLAEALEKDYHYLSTLFSSVEGITIEKYIILQKIERVKELLIYDELNLSEIAFKLNYSSSQHLSNQFKKTTGMTPTEFKNAQNQSRKPLDSITK